MSSRTSGRSIVERADGDVPPVADDVVVVVVDKNPEKCIALVMAKLNYFNSFYETFHQPSLLLSIFLSSWACEKKIY